MFEGNPPRQAKARPLDGEQEGGILRELTWAELVARLSTSRTMRVAPPGLGEPFGDEGGDASFGASFDAGCARRIAAHHSGKDFLNHAALDDGKQRPAQGWVAVWRSPTPRGNK